MSPKTISTLKLIALLILGFAVFIFVAAFIVDTDFSAERSVIIDRSDQEIFEYVRFLENQYNYSVWGEMDPDMEREFHGTDGTVGFVSSWEGNEEVGRGEQEIVGIVEGERIDYELRFYEPFESSAESYMIVEPVTENQTRVRWGFSGSMPRPMNLMLLFMNMDELIGSDFETGLNNLKQILESTETETETETETN